MSERKIQTPYRMTPSEQRALALHDQGVPAAQIAALCGQRVAYTAIDKRRAAVLWESQQRVFGTVTLQAARGQSNRVKPTQERIQEALIAPRLARYPFAFTRARVAVG